MGYSRPSLPQRTPHSLVLHGVKVARLHPSAMYRLQALSYKAFRKISVNQVKYTQQ